MNIDMRTIQVAGITAQVEWKKIKNVHLTIYPPDARIHVSAPETMTDDSVRLFLLTKSDWIKKRVEEILGQERQSFREYVSGENHYFTGKRYRLKVFEHNAASHVQIQGKDFIVMYVRPNTSRDKREEIMREWYRSQLKKILPPLIEKWAKILDVDVARWDVKQMKTLWGSCNHERHSILFNLELAKKPMRCIEYIVAHELTHIKVRLHNEEFTAILNEIMPNWKLIRDELNEFIV